ncbi:unnamed protein product [Phaeothamnion confervicola]
MAAAQQGCLLSPAVQRRLNEISAGAERARRLLHKAGCQRARLDFLVANEFRHGALQVDSPDNPESAVYGARWAEVRADAEAAAAQALKRAHHLDTKQGDPRHRFGFHLLHHHTAEQPPPADSAKFMPSRGGRVAPLDTYARLFEQRGQALRPERTRKLREESCGGRIYDIVSGEQRPPCQMAERVNRCLAHPSQQSIAGTRNLQGAFVPV